VIRRFSIMALSLWICTLAFLPHIGAAAPSDRAQVEQVEDRLDLLRKSGK
jgi:hypothetical protein